MWCLVFSAIISTVHYVSAESSSRIIQGTDTTIEQLPYMAILYLNGNHNCGGTIVRERWILTVAQCLRWEPQDYTVRVGSTYRLEGGEMYDVKNIYVHPKFELETFDFDVALAELFHPIEFGIGVQPLKLIDRGQEVPNGSLGLIAGWGSRVLYGSSVPSLLYGTVPVQDWNECRNTYRFIREVTDRMICAGHYEGGTDGCSGDGGAPLVVNGEAVGLISWGQGCGTPTYYGVYTKIAAVRDWIDEILSIGV